MIDGSHFFDRNMVSLSTANPELYRRLSKTLGNAGCYRFVDSRLKDAIPAYIDINGNAHTLHSLISAEKEAEKLIGTIKTEGFVIILGLGGGYLVKAALEKPDIQKIVVIDYDIDGLAALLRHKDFSPFFLNPCFTLLHDISPATIEQYLIENYFPAIHNGIRVIPLRPRCDFDEAHFSKVYPAIKNALDKVSADYSVQAYFGKRWFSNTTKNIFALENQFGFIAPQSNIAICAAGPSLDRQLELLKEKQKARYIISTDTAAGSLIHAGIKPDAVISIDCQHISYLHFLGNDISNMTLFLDLASPPLLYARAKKTVFFCGGHPLAQYLRAYFKQLPFIDTSGGNVTFAAVSLAEKLGAKDIEIYGADFSYPEGNAYTKGAFFYPYLNMKQSRLAPSTAQLADFLFKNKSIKRITVADSYYYETQTLEMYRKKLEEKSEHTSLNIVKAGLAPIHIRGTGGTRQQENKKTINLFSSGKNFLSATEFLRDYKNKILGLPDLEGNINIYIKNLSDIDTIVFHTLLPTAAALKRSAPLLSNKELIGELKTYCVKKIDVFVKSAR
jgi:hypothetical protein